MAAVERAADVQTAKRKAAGAEQAAVTVKGVPVESVFCAVHRSISDVALTYNQLEPKLGDRVVNLTCPGVPFGFRGTVVTIHSNTKYVEVGVVIRCFHYCSLLIASWRCLQQYLK
jgi:hypothetical protein